MVIHVVKFFLIHIYFETAESIFEESLVADIRCSCRFFHSSKISNVFSSILIVRMDFLHDMVIKSDSEQENRIIKKMIIYNKFREKLILILLLLRIYY